MDLEAMSTRELQLALRTLDRADRHHACEILSTREDINEVTVRRPTQADTAASTPTPEGGA